MAATDSEDQELAELRSPKVPHAIEIVGAVAGMLPFGVHVTTTSSSSVNGELVASSYRDYVALGGAGLAVLCGVGSFILLSRTMPKNRSIRLVIALGLLVLAGLQTARGLGAIQVG